MQQFGVVGFPVEHSLSPVMQQPALDHAGLEAEFQKYLVEPSEISGFVDRIRTEKIAGAAVTVPHKESIMQHLERITDVAQRIGAVNTLYWRENTLIGDNTDWWGAMKALESLDLENQPVALIGAGGAAKAVLYALDQLEANATVFNRTFEKAQTLAQESNNIQAGMLEDFTAKDYTLVINATSVGLKNPSASPVPEKSWDAFSGTAFDIVYDPLETKFLKDAQAAGGQIITGEKMLLWQGIRQFELWTGEQADIEVMQKALNNYLS